MREVIVRLGDRRNSGFCLSCGTTLIQPCNDYQCCSKCTDVIMRGLNALEKKDRDRNKKKGGKKIVVQRNQILKQIVPVGVPVK